MAVNWRPVESQTQARSPGVESQSRIERARNNGRSCYARRSCGRCPDYKRIAFFSLPLPSPRSRCKKQEGRTRDRATRRVTLFGAKQTKRKRFVRSKISARAVTGSLTTFLSFHGPVEGGKGEKSWLVFPTIMRSESSSFPFLVPFE